MASGPGQAPPPLTRQEIAQARRREAAEEKMARVIARQAAIDERDRMRRLHLDVQLAAARRVHDKSAAEHRPWFHDLHTKNAADAPGPGSYSVDGIASSITSKSAVEPLKAMAGRRPMVDGRGEGPGPAAYDGDSELLDRRKHVGAVPFNSRPKGFEFDSSHAGPGPAAYSPERVDFPSIASASFGSGEQRARESEAARHSPAPNAYDPRPVEKESGGKFAVGRKEYLKREKARRKYQAKERRANLLPGPGHYSLPAETSRSGQAHRFASGREARADPDSELRPGPGAYFPTISVKREKEMEKLRKELLRRELSSLLADG